MGHLSAEQLVDLAEGARPESSAPHLRSCVRCRETLVELRATLSVAASVKVPEPSPLFWDHLSARVHDAVEAEGAAGTPAGVRWWWSRVSPLRMATFAIAVLALVMVLRGGRPVVPVPVPARAPAGAIAAVGEGPGDALAVLDDPSLSLVADLAADLDWDAAFEAGLTTHVGVDNDAVTDLTDSERRVLDQLLIGELAHRGA